MATSSSSRSVLPLITHSMFHYRVFTLYDADGDGVISRTELRDVVMAIHRLSPHGKSIKVLVAFNGRRTVFASASWPAKEIYGQEMRAESGRDYEIRRENIPRRISGNKQGRNEGLSELQT